MRNAIASAWWDGESRHRIACIATTGRVSIIAPTRDELNLDLAEQIATFIAMRPWQPVINAVAYTDVDRTEDKPARHFAINAEMPHRSVVVTASRGIPLVHLLPDLTDYSFDERKGNPYDEDARAPTNIRLDCAMIMKNWAIRPRLWRTELDEMIDRLLPQQDFA